MNTSEMNAIGRIVALANAEAEDADLATPASATPRVAKHAEPIVKVSTMAGSLASSRLTS